MKYNLEAVIDSDVEADELRKEEVLIRILINGRARATKILSLTVSAIDETPPATTEEE